jgi:sodium/potassium-transporting ATPase subunit alpha
MLRCSVLAVSLPILQLSFAWDKPETVDGLMRMAPRKPGDSDEVPFILQVLKLLLVNDRSILSIKKRALRRTRTFARDSEGQSTHKPSWMSTFIIKLKAPFTRAFWEDAFEHTDNETLVDSKLLSYAYLEAGLIETIAWYIPNPFSCWVF